MKRERYHGNDIIRALTILGDFILLDILVYLCLQEFSDYTPKFVKHFAELGEKMQAAFKAYDAEVKAGTFPDAAHSFKIDDDVMERLY